MVQRFFVDSSGTYLGSFDGPDVEIPALFSEAIEVPKAPIFARQVWSEGEWQRIVDATPESVSARQFKMQLVIDGLKAQVDAWIANQDELTQIAYEYSGSFVRSEPAMQAGFKALGFTSEKTAAFFLAASQL